jgi:hypothetical protein
MHKIIVISTLLFATACGHKQAPPASSASQSSTAAPKTEGKTGDKDSKVDEGAKDKDGDHDKEDDEGPAKAKH